MPKKNDFKLDVVSVRLVKDAPIYSEHTFNNPADIAAVIKTQGDEKELTLFTCSQKGTMRFVVRCIYKEAVMDE